MNKNKLTKEAQVLDKKINELAKTTTRKLKQAKSKGVDHSRSTSQKLKHLKQRNRNGYCK